MSNKLMIHCGGRNASFGDVLAVPVPAQTPTYTPVAHGDFIHTVQAAADTLLPQPLIGTEFALTKDGDRMFGVLTWGPSTPEGVARDPDALDMSAGIRNSYDRSMSAALGLGGRTFVCDNLCISGSIATFKFRHTGAVLERLRTAIVTTLFDAQSRFANLRREVQALRETTITDRDGHHFFGQLYGADIINTTQFTAANRDWKKPAFDNFAPRTGWSAYSCVNAALKSTNPAQILASHVNLHEHALEMFTPDLSAPTPTPAFN